jgi:hypothetical protein
LIILLIWRKSGIGEGFSDERQCKRAIEKGWDSVLVAVDSDLNILGTTAQHFLLKFFYSNYLFIIYCFVPVCVCE